MANEFTLDELIILQKLINRESVDMNDGVMLRGKLQATIDNYCEHLNEDRLEDNYCARCKQQVIVCA